MISKSDNILENASSKTASLLLNIDAVKFNIQKPFTLASSLNSPTYIDCRKIISYPNERKIIMDLLNIKVTEIQKLDRIDVIAGGETAGIPFGAMLAERLDLPMIYVRKKPKGYGHNSQIEGLIEPKQNVLLVEDLATDGGSKINFVNAIRKTGAICNHTIVIFYYGIFDTAELKLSQQGINLHFLATWKDILKVARSEKKVDAKTFHEISSFLKDPIQWSKTYNLSQKKNP